MQSSILLQNGEEGEGEVLTVFIYSGFLNYFVLIIHEVVTNQSESELDI
jgi:hypothetical protein